MQKIKSLLFSSCLLLTSSTIAIAGGPDNYTPPPPSGKIFFGTTLGGFKQSNVNTEYAIQGLSSQFNGVGPMLRVPTHYDFGWGLHLGYLFPNNNDAAFYFFSYDGRHRDSTTQSQDTNIKVVSLPAEYNTDNAESANSLYEYNIHLYRLAFGHHFHWAKNAFSFHPYFGVGLANVKAGQSSEYFNGTNQITPTFDNASVTQRSSFNGAGPLVGFDLAWHIWRYFSFVGGASWNGIIARIKHEYSAIHNPPGTSQDPYGITSRSSPSVISILCFTAGITADFAMGKVDMNVMLGYKATKFMNAIKKLNLVDSTADNLSVNQQLDMSFQGPFVQLSAAI